MLTVKLRLILYKLVETFLNQLSSRVCKKCRNKITDKHLIICKSCIKEEAASQKNYELKNSKLKAYFQFPYRDKLFRKLILDFKKDKPELSYFFATALYEMISKKMKLAKNQKIFISYVPISEEKYKLRKYNQSYLLSKALYKIFKTKHEKTELLKNLFIREKNTKALQNLNQKMREKELESAFSLNASYISLLKELSLNSKDTILIIDDISTTGLTLIKLQELLIQKGIDDKQILAFTATGRNFD